MSESESGGFAPLDTDDAAAAGGGGGGGSDSGLGPLELLMETEPDLDPSTEPSEDVGPAVSHAYVGVRKVIHGVVGVGGVTGTPALINFVLAGYHGFVGGVEVPVGSDDGAEGPGPNEWSDEWDERPDLDDDQQ